MEPANIDWKNIDSRFVLDDLYEHINAPKWVDFYAPEDSVDDEAWFCKSDCRHPKTTEDLLRKTPNSKDKHMRSASISEILPLGDRNRRDANLKRRGILSSSNSSNHDPKFNKTPTSKPLYKFKEDYENENPNISTPPKNHQSKILKAAIKSSAEKKKPSENSPAHSSENDRKPKLKSTSSMRNLFTGREILNQVTEFCNELKKLAMRAKERDDIEKLNVKKTQISGKNFESAEQNSGDSDVIERENKPLLEVEKGNSEVIEKGSMKVKQRRKIQRNDEEMENIPITVNLKNIKREESLLQVRTCPPSPQCFSASNGGTHCKSRAPAERGILQEVKHQKINNLMEVTEEKKPEDDKKSNKGSVSIAPSSTERARSLDMFWFLKPCTFLAK